MRWAFVLSLLMVLAAVQGELYSTDNDHLDIAALTEDPATLRAFLDCFNDKGPCDETSSDFKKDIQEAVQQACAKCTEAQKNIFKVFLETIKVKESEGYKVFQQKYDPQNKYIDALLVAIS